MAVTAHPYARAVTHPPLYGLDIETDTTIDGLNPAFAAVVAAAVSTPQGDQVVLGDERDILRQLDGLLMDLPAGLIVTWNGAAFDLPFLRARAALLGLPLALQLAANGHERPHHDRPDGAATPVFTAAWGAHRHLDGYRLYRADVGRSLGLSCGLKALARLAGLPAVEVDRARIHLLDGDELTDYVASDARLAVELVARRLPAAAAFTDRLPAGDDDPLAALSTVTDW